MAYVLQGSFCTSFKFSFLEYSLGSGKVAWEISERFDYKKEQTFWGLKGFVFEDTPVSWGVRVGILQTELFFVVLGLEFRAYTLSYSTSPIFVKV
jgi:hypothetical protein